MRKIVAAGSAAAALAALALGGCATRAGMVGRRANPVCLGLVPGLRRRTPRVGQRRARLAESSPNLARRRGRFASVSVDR